MSATEDSAPTAPKEVGPKKTKIVVNVAVSDLVGKGVSQPEADLITEQVRANMLSTGTFKVMERSMMDQIMKEQGFQQSGNCDNSECMVEVGRILGVQNLVVGSVGKVGRIFMINVKIVDVNTGEVLKSLTETCECAIEQLLQETPPKVAQALDHEVRKGKAGTIAVNTEPQGAVVFLDQVSVGRTPWKSDLLDPGTYSLSLVLPDWKRIEKMVDVQTEKQAAFALSLERSDDWIAARKAEEEQKAPSRAGEASGDPEAEGSGAAAEEARVESRSVGAVGALRRDRVLLPDRRRRQRQIGGRSLRTLQVDEFRVGDELRPFDSRKKRRRSEDGAHDAEYRLRAGSRRLLVHHLHLLLLRRDEMRNWNRNGIFAAIASFALVGILSCNEEKDRVFDKSRRSLGDELFAAERAAPDEERDHGHGRYGPD